VKTLPEPALQRFKAARMNALRELNRELMEFWESNFPQRYTEALPPLPHYTRLFPAFSRYAAALYRSYAVELAELYNIEKEYVVVLAELQGEVLNWIAPCPDGNNRRL